MSDSLVIIPTYNERENAEKIIRKVFSLPKEFHILVVDDGSPDGTAGIIKNLQIEFPEKLHIEERKGKLGLGTAYIHGFKWAIRKKYDFIYEMDADFSHNPEDLERLYKACTEQGADVAVGSRYVKGGNVKNWPFGRILMSYFASVYVRLILWINIKDTTAGFKCYKRKVLETIDLDSIRFMGYAFQIEMKYTALKLGFKVVEVPITFIDRKEGVSKMSSSIFKEAFLGVLQMKFSNIKARRAKPASTSKH
ncbi:MAG: polyprenol monophosphomannose synthase [Bacteroidetes bacterium]|nr:polyprenol monophosphomannose synthase [Bacteroidota bacterium]